MQHTEHTSLLPFSREFTQLSSCPYSPHVIHGMPFPKTLIVLRLLQYVPMLGGPRQRCRKEAARG